jgi:hypothetical protein
MTDTLADMEAIRQLKARYCQLMDQGRWSEWGALYLPDAELAPPVEGMETLVGGAAIARFAEQSLQGIKTSHLAGNPQIELTGPTSARATWTVQFAQGGGRLRGFGFYEDEYEKRDGRWLIRSVHLVTSWAEGPAVPPQWPTE